MGRANLGIADDAISILLQDGELEFRENNGGHLSVLIKTFLESKSTVTLWTAKPTSNTIVFLIFCVIVTLSK